MHTRQQGWQKSATHCAESLQDTPKDFDIFFQEQPEYVDKMLFDDVIKKVGEFGPYQIGLYCLLGFVGIPAGKVADYSANNWAQRNLGITLGLFKKQQVKCDDEVADSKWSSSQLIA